MRIKPSRTTWRGTPLHELWLRDPSGYLIEIYAPLTSEELLETPGKLRGSVPIRHGLSTALRTDVSLTPATQVAGEAFVL